MARDNTRGFGAGSRQGDPYAETATDGVPVDIAAVRRDDELIDAIVSDGQVATDSSDEYEIATLLANWRAELTGPPLPLAPDVDEVVAAVNQEIGARHARVAAGGRLRLLRPIAGAAAAIALVVGGMSAFSYNAEPGDPLWKVKQVVFSEQADSTVANIDTTTDLQEAERLIAANNPEEAKIYLDRAAARATDVNDSAQRNDLLDWFNRLTAEAQRQLPQTATPESIESSPLQTSDSTRSPGSSSFTGDSVIPTNDPRSEAPLPGIDTGTPGTSGSVDTSILIAPTTPDPTAVDKPTTEVPPPPATTIEVPTTTEASEPPPFTGAPPPSTTVPSTTS